jgi:hypothetical protein
VFLCAGSSWPYKHYDRIKITGNRKYSSRAKSHYEANNTLEIREVRTNLNSNMADSRVGYE